MSDNSQNEKNISSNDVEAGLIEQPQAEQPSKGKKKEEKDPRRKWYVTAAIIMLAIIIILLLLLLRQCSSDVPVLNPDYPPVSDDPNVDKIPDDDDDKLDHEEGGGAVSLQFQDQLTIDISDKKAYLYFANPGRSTQNMMLQIVIQDQVIAQSGRLRPGYQLKELDLLEDAEKKLAEGIYEGKFTVYYYDPETNEKAMVNTDAPVTITVKK